MAHYLYIHWLEIFGVISSIVYLYFSINRKVWLWLMGIISSSIYVIVFFNSSLYADMIQQLYYVVVSVYGYLRWIYRDKTYNQKSHQVEVARISKKAAVRMAILALIIFIIIYFSIKFLPNLLNIQSASIPLLDSILTALCFVGTWMLTKRYIEYWLIFIYVDAAYVFVYWYKGLYFTILLFVVYTIMAIIGYYKWKATLNGMRVKLKV